MSHQSDELKRKVLIPSFKLALVVGTLLSLINQTHCFIDWDFPVQALSRIGLNYTVPLCVSSYARYSTWKDHQRELLALGS